MPTPDVRVRLSAEGVAEVVGALRRVQAEGDKAAAKQSRGFLGLNRVLGSTTGLLSGLGVVLGVRQFQGWIKGSVDAADRMQELGQKTAASTEHLSALNLIARTAGSSLEELGVALAKQNKFIGEALEGNAQARASFRDLGLELADFKGKDSVEIFELIAKRIAALPSPLQKGKIAMDIFGRSGANLLPTMNELAEEGLGKLIARAEELGVLIDTKLAAAADQMNDDFELLKAQSEGLGARLAAGLVPQLSQALQIVSGDLKQTVKSWESFGKGIGTVIKFVVAVASSGFDIVASMISGSLMAIDASTRSLWLLVRGRIKEAREYFKAANEAIAKQQEDLFDRLQGRFVLAFTAPPEPTMKPRVPAGELAEDPAEVAAKRAQAMQTVLDRELAMSQAQATLRNTAEKRAFDEGLKDVRAYYKARRSIAEDSFAKTEEILNKKRELLAAEVDPARRLQEEGKIDAELAQLRLQREEALAAITFEERDAVRDLAQERLALERDLLEAQGRRSEAALLGIDEEIRKTDLLLRKQGVGEADREKALERLRQSLKAGVGFDDAKQQAEAALGSLDAIRSEIDAKVAAGLLSQFEAEQQLLALEEKRLAGLQGLAQELINVASATGDPEKIAQAYEFARAVGEIGLAIDASKISFRAFATTAVDAGHDALVEFFDTGITGARSLGDAFRDMASSVIASLRRMAAEILAVAIMKKIAGIFGFEFGGQMGEWQGPVQKAAGGILTGRGTRTSDSNLAWFSRGEYLVRAAVVQEPGVLRHLEELNKRGARAIADTPILADFRSGAYAEGGLIDDRGRADRNSGELNGELLIGLDEGLLLKALRTKQGQRIIVRTIANNRRAVRSSLGG